MGLTVLDTNVVSELMRPRPDPAVVAWVDARPTALLALTAVTAAELFHGVARLPDGRRRAALAEVVGSVVDDHFDGRVLGFDVVAAGHYGDLVARREATGRPIGVADGQIAAVCRSHGATLATRNTADFLDVGIEVVDPWLAP